jgi:hypothetical protein
MAEETPQTTARLEARLPNDVHALLKRAAEIEGRTLTDFVVSAAREAALPDHRSDRNYSALRRGPTANRRSPSKSA